MTDAKFKKGQAVSFTYSHRGGTTKGKGKVDSINESGRVSVKLEDGSKTVQLWPSQLTAA